MSLFLIAIVFSSISLHGLSMEITHRGSWQEGLSSWLTLGNSHLLKQSCDTASMATTVVWNSGPEFPPTLKALYDSQAVLGSGSFGTTFKARCKKTGEIVAVKVLANDPNSISNWWLTPNDARKGDYEALINESKKECATLTRIENQHSFERAESRHVVRCLIDGISNALESSESSLPLHIVMEFAGLLNLNAWWLRRITGQVPERQLLSELQSLSRQMMLGLKHLNDGTVKWVHHDLKPENMVVDDGANITLTIVDFGTALSTLDPEETSASTQIFRPPEHFEAGATGFSMPAHSYDSFSAALSIMALAGGSTSDELFYPDFYKLNRERAHIAHADLRAAAQTAECISMVMKERRIDASDSAGWNSCLQHCFESSLKLKLSQFLVADLDRVRRAVGERRKEALVRLISCRDGFQKANTPALNVVHEWIDSRFDETLLAMLSADPRKRPSPSVVLESPWLERTAHQLPPSSGFALTTEIVCPLAMPGFQQLVRFVALCLLIGCLLSSCFFMMCCSFYGGLPCGGDSRRVSWIGLLVAMHLLGTTCASEIWFDSGTMTVLCFLLATASCVLGRKAADRKPAWGITLLATVVVCMCMEISTYSTVSSLLHQLNIAQKHGYLFPYLRVTVQATLVPPVLGALFGLYGLWDMSKHHSMRRPTTDLEDGFELQGYRV